MVVQATPTVCYGQLPRLCPQLELSTAKWVRVVVFDAVAVVDIVFTHQTVPTLTRTDSTLCILPNTEGTH